MDKQSMTKSSSVKKMQHKNLMILLGIAVVVIIGIAMMADDDTASTTAAKTETVSLASPINRVDAQSVWIERAQNQLAENMKATSAVKEQMQLLQQRQEEKSKQTQEQVDLLNQLQTKVANLEQQLNAKKVDNQPSGSGELFPGQAGHENDVDTHHFINDNTLNLTPRKLLNTEMMPSKNPTNYVPAGTYVKAVVLEGADASAGVTSQANPTPILFRILEQGTLPNHGKSHLKDCVATSAAVGDISSERGEIRLERLSCTKDNGQIIEMPVEATVAGPDGKNGLRGVPLWRESALLQRAFMAGTLSGISNGVSQSYTSNSLSPFGSVQTVNPNKILQFGLANGVGSAAEKLAEYNIKRAEQFHPVIQLSAGTLVDLVFLKGFYVDGKKHNEDEEEALETIPPNDLAKEASNQTTVPAGVAENNDFNGPSPLPLSPEQIQTLKKKNAEQGYH